MCRSSLQSGQVLAVYTKTVLSEKINVDICIKKTNTVNMVGERIKQARLALGATLDEIASDLTESGTPITKAGLSKYEKGKSTPSQTFMMALAKRLEVKPSFFITEPEYEIGWHAFRRHAKLPKKLQEHVKASAERQIDSFLRLFAIFHKTEKPKFPRPFPVANFDDVEAAALQLRKTWGLRNQTIGCLVQLTEANSVIVIGHSGIERDRQFDGLSGIANGKFPVAVISTSGTDDRIRYTLAHERGHLAMDCTDIEPKQEEEFAHRFASAFIVPQEVMRKELGENRRNVGLREFAVLKQKHGLSMQSLVRRARDLDIISQSHYTSLFRKFSSMGWRKKEPVDYKSDEKPKRLLQMLLRAVSEGIMDQRQAEQILPGSMENKLKEHKRQTASDVRKLSVNERRSILEAAANKAVDDYRADSPLMDFEAIGEEDLYVDYE